MPPLIIPVGSCVAIGCIPCSAAARACQCISWSLLPTCMMPLLLVRSSLWPSVSIAFASASSVWMLPSGACNSFTGSMPLMASQCDGSLESQATEKTARVCRERWRHARNWACRSAIERFKGPRLPLLSRGPARHSVAGPPSLDRSRFPYTATIVVAASRRAGQARLSSSALLSAF